MKSLSGSALSSSKSFAKSCLSAKVFEETQEQTRFCQILMQFLWIQYATTLYHQAKGNAEYKPHLLILYHFLYIYIFLYKSYRNKNQTHLQKSHSNGSNKSHGQFQQKPCLESEKWGEFFFHHWTSEKIPFLYFFLHQSWIWQTLGHVMKKIFLPPFS